MTAILLPKTLLFSINFAIVLRLFSSLSETNLTMKANHKGFKSYIKSITVLHTNKSTIRHGNSLPSSRRKPLIFKKLHYFLTFFFISNIIFFSQTKILIVLSEKLNPSKRVSRNPGFRVRLTLIQKTYFIKFS